MVKYTHMSQIEIELARRWYNEDGMGSIEISKLLRRSRRTVSRHVTVVKKPKAKVGRFAMSAQNYAKCESACVSAKECEGPA